MTTEKIKSGCDVCKRTREQGATFDRSGIVCDGCLEEKEGTPYEVEPPKTKDPKCTKKGTGQCRSYKLNIRDKLTERVACLDDCSERSPVQPAVMPFKDATEATEQIGIEFGDYQPPLQHPAFLAESGDRRIEVSEAGMDHFDQIKPIVERVLGTDPIMEQPVTAELGDHIKLQAEIYAAHETLDLHGVAVPFDNFNDSIISLCKRLNSADDDNKNLQAENENLRKPSLHVGLNEQMELDNIELKKMIKAMQSCDNCAHVEGDTDGNCLGHGESDDCKGWEFSP